MTRVLPRIRHLLIVKGIFIFSGVYVDYIGATMFLPNIELRLTRNANNNKIGVLEIGFVWWNKGVYFSFVRNTISIR